MDLKDEFIVKRKSVRNCGLYARLSVIEDVALPPLSDRIQHLFRSLKVFLLALGHVLGRKQRIVWHYLLINEKGEQVHLAGMTADYQVE